MEVSKLPPMPPDQEKLVASWPREARCGDSCAACESQSCFGSRRHLQESALFKELKGSQPFFLMAGPNVIQSEEHCLKMCRQIKAVCGAFLHGLSAQSRCCTAPAFARAASPWPQPRPAPSSRSCKLPPARLRRQPGHQAGVQILL